MWTFIIAAAIILAGVFIYNGLVQLRTRAKNAWADIDVQLKRRYDLIPNLVEIVKGYTAHERETLEAVVEARNRAIAADGPAEKGVAEAGLERTLGSLFALSEGYPDLKAADTYIRLHTELVAVEDALQNARRYYNAVVRDYNTRIAQVPFNFIAWLLNFKRKEFFSASYEEAENVAIAL